MPAAIIAVVVIGALGAGFFFLSSSPDETPTQPSEVAVRPSDETDDSTPTVTDDTDDDEDDESDTNQSDDEMGDDTEAESADDSTYADGTYTASATYLTPRRTEHEVGVTLTLEDDVVVDSTVTFNGVEGEYDNDNQARFDQAYTEEVVGQPLDAVSLSRVGGASLTSGAFNEAKTKIVTQASS